MNPTPPRMTLARYDDPSDSLEAQANPPEFTETYGTEWAKQKIPGLSHSRKQFVQTLDRSISLRLEFYALNEDGRSVEGAKFLLSAREFLLQMCRPRKLANNISTGGSPLLVFFWPSFMTMVANLETVSFNYKRFNRIGAPVEMTADLKLEEVRFDLITSDALEEVVS